MSMLFAVTLLVWRGWRTCLWLWYIVTSCIKYVVVTRFRIPCINLLDLKSSCRHFWWYVLCNPWMKWNSKGFVWKMSNSLVVISIIHVIVYNFYLKIYHILELLRNYWIFFRLICLVLWNRVFKQLSNVSLCLTFVLNASESNSIKKACLHFTNYNINKASINISETSEQTCRNSTKNVVIFFSIECVKRIYFFLQFSKKKKNSSLRAVSQTHWSFWFVSNGYLKEFSKKSLSYLNFAIKIFVQNFIFFTKSSRKLH